MVGAPVSVDSVFLVGPDAPGLIGEQFGVSFAGAAATGVGMLCARWWRWLVVVGAVGMVVGHLIRVPVAQGVSVRVAGARGPEPDISAHPVWVALLVAASALLLVGVLGAAQELLRDNRIGVCLAGFAGCAGYFGVAVVGRLRGLGAPERVIVVGLVAGATVAAAISVRGNGLVRGRGQWAELVAAAAALVWLLPTMIVAVRDQAVFGTVLGGVIGLGVLGVALTAARPAGGAGVLVVAATGLVLGSPVAMLVLLWDVPLGGVWYGWPVALAGVLVGAGAAAGPSVVRAGVVAAAGLSMIGLAIGQPSALVLWLFLGLSMAAVAVTVGSATEVLAGIDAAPALASLGTLAGLGVFGALNLVRAGRSPVATQSAVAWVAAVLVLAGAGLLLGLRSVHRGQLAVRG